MALSTASWGHHAGGRPEDTAGPLDWGLRFLERNGFTHNFHSCGEQEELAGTLARLYALSNTPRQLEEMRKLAAPHLHPARVSQPKSEPVVEPPAFEKRGRKNNRTRTLKLRVSEEELADYQAWAERTGKPVADLLRRGARDELEYEAVDRGLEKPRHD